MKKKLWIGSAAFVLMLIGAMCFIPVSVFSTTTTPVLYGTNVPTADSTANNTSSDVVGSKSDAAATGAVGTTTSIMGYIKQLVTGQIVNDGNIDAILVDTGTTIPGTITTLQNDLDIITGATGVNLLTATQASIDATLADTDTISGATLPATPTAGSLATFVSGGSTALGQPLPASTSLVDIIGDFTGPYGGAAQDDNIKASLDLAHTDIDAILLDTAAMDTSAEVQALVTGSTTGGADLLNIAWTQMAYQMGSVEGSAQGMPAAFWWVDGNITSSGDGTTPATAFKTIQEAIAACSNSVDDWVFVFDLSDSGATTITMDKSFVHLIGNSTNGAMAYPRIFPSTAVAGITFAATGDRVEIANLVIGGGDQTVPAISFPVATAAGAYGVNIHDCVIGRDADAPCLEGIYVASGGAAPYLVVKNNRFYGSDGAGIAAAGSAIRIAGNATHCNISGNFIQDVGRTATPAIWLDGAVTNPQIENNRIKFDTDTGTGSAITLGASVDDGWIAGNWANDGQDAPGNNPFVDAGSTNGWAENYSGIVAVLP